MRIMYPSNKGGKPLNIGMNRAKRVARLADQRDQLAVLRTLGDAMPDQHSHHQELVRQRHQYYADAYEENQRAIESRNKSASDQATGAAVGAVPEPAPGPAAG